MSTLKEKIKNLNKEDAIEEIVEEYQKHSNPELMSKIVKRMENLVHTRRY